MKQTSLFPDPKQERRDAHHCHARRCAAHVPPERLMCRGHWFMVPKRVRDAVWATYREGQCDDMSPSKEWHQAADAAIGFVALEEGHPLTPNETAALVHFGYLT